MSNREKNQQAANEAQKIASGQQWNESHGFTNSVNNNAEEEQNFTNEQQDVINPS